MKQRKRIQILLLVALSGLSTIGYAQGKTCFGTAYEIKELQAPSAPSTFQWVENGQDIPGANAATYTIPAGKPKGKYTYLRNSLKEEGCDWGSSNAYTVEVITCGTITSGDLVGTIGSFQDPRDQKLYKIVKMPDEKVWFAENLNYQTDLMYNSRPNIANNVPFTTTNNGALAIGSFWCPGLSGGQDQYATSRNMCSVYGALYTWETAMMADGKYSDGTKTNSTWDESWVSGNYYTTGAPGSTPAANVNNARDGGRGICPVGWHIPTDLEWAQLLDKVEGDGSSTSYTVGQSAAGWWGSDAGKKLKSKTTAMSDDGAGAWVYDEQNINIDTYGYSVLPAGCRFGDGSHYRNRSNTAFIWTSSLRHASQAWFVSFSSDRGSAYRGQNTRTSGYPVRCLKN